MVMALKVTFSIAIIGYLIWQAKQDNAFVNLRDQPKQWAMLVVAWFFCAGAVLTTIVRWHYLIRALEIPSRLTASLRIGFLGYMFNLAPLGILGGDAIKAVMLAREHKGTQAKSVASVVVDRLIGLYMLFVVASAAILITGFSRVDDPTVARICSITHWCTALGALGIAALMVPAVLDGKFVRSMEHWPRVGATIAHLTEAMRMYRRRPGVLLIAAIMSIGVHSLFATGVYFIARGLPGNVHSLGAHFVMSPLSAATGVLPLPIGPFEFVLDFLYVQVPIVGAAIPKGQGLVVALGYRVITVLIAAIGACYYIGARQEVARSIQEAREDNAAVGGPSIAMSEASRSASAA
ncbi:MAG: flippase-like domain-containing protein [Pirellulales bacterium]|nr:flippase-like domain-containing protein [Pirellulales bacterium]